MQFDDDLYQGQGVNHEQEVFTGQFVIHRMSSGDTLSYQYTATLEDGTQVHQESGLIGKNEDHRLCVFVFMDELPCITPHELIHQEDGVWVFGYEGVGPLAGFNSELVFRFEGKAFRLEHRWAMNGPAVDRSWCLLEAVK